MDIEAIALYWRDRPGKVTAALKALQKELGYLEEGAMKKLAEALDVPYSQLYGVATFFSAFRLEPRGKTHVKVCRGTACHVRGADQIIEKLERDLEIEAGKTTPDRRFSLEVVRCLGCCGLAPVVAVNETTYARFSQVRTERLLHSSEGNDDNTL